VLGTIFLLLIVNNQNFNDNQRINNEIIEHQNEIYGTNPNTSGWWNNFTFIHIDGNWSVAASYAWCRGDGIWNNPYIIENITIDATDSPTGNGIFINNSKNDYFIIRNCTVSNSRGGVYYAGITLNNTNNGTLIDNRCSSNLGNGILLFDDCDNNTILGNIANGNSYSGIRLDSTCTKNTISGNKAGWNEVNGIVLYNKCVNNTILGNTIKANEQHGIHLYTDCDNNTISDNAAYFNWDHGIELNSGCDNNTITGNDAKDNYRGIYIKNDCNDNIIYRNNASYIGISMSYQNYGITLEVDCDNNILFGNLIENNYVFGINIESASCENNLIYQNSLIGNGGSATGSQARDYGTNNQWDKSGVGNYWDNHTSPDSPIDGIVDTPYIWIPGSANSEDSFPLAKSPIHIGYKIHIDDDGINALNWFRTAKLNLWCTGSGSYSNPYLIDGLEINGGGTESCILIENSDLYFTVQNCHVYNAGTGTNDAGIKLEKTFNGMISNNNCSDNGRRGILLINYCGNNTISGNIANDNSDGIRLEEHSNNNTIMGNFVNDNSAGIYMEWWCDDNNITGNTAMDNTHGIYIYRFCDYNNISGNNANENTVNGIYIRRYCDNNNISGNTANDNDLNGILLGLDCNNNSIIGNNASNIISSNQNSGIRIDSNENTVIGNRINNNVYNGIAINSDNNNASENRANDNGYSGIYISGNNNNISGNTVRRNKYGIYLESGNFNNLTGNTINNNSQYGIYLGIASNARLSGNQLFECGIGTFGSFAQRSSHTIYTDNKVNGRTLYYYVDEIGLIANDFTGAGQIILINCNESTISNVNVSHASLGIHLYNSDNNTISGSIASDNSQYGIYLDENCNNNTISENNITKNDNIGLFIDNLADGNTVYKNNFTNNGIHAQDDGLYNKWDNGTIGNYWDNYTGVDANDDGIGDTPYNIPGTAGSKDRFPIWDDGLEVPLPPPNGNGNGDPPPPPPPPWWLFVLISAIGVTVAIVLIKKMKK